jgi:hypothetical protein
LQKRNLREIERMLNVMALVPQYGWGILLAEVAKVIGTDALQKIIERVYAKTDSRKPEDLKRALAMIKREKAKPREARPHDRPGFRFQHDPTTTSSLCSRACAFASEEKLQPPESRYAIYVL